MRWLLRRLLSEKRPPDRRDARRGFREGPFADVVPGDAEVVRVILRDFGPSMA